MTPSIEPLIEEFQAVVFDKNELEYRDMSILIALVSLLTHRDSSSAFPTQQATFIIFGNK